MFDYYTLINCEIIQIFKIDFSINESEVKMCKYNLAFLLKQKFYDKITLQE